VNELEKRIFSEKEDRTAPDCPERRREPRVQVDRLVYVQAADSQVGHFEEVRSMRDLSRSGFYFTTERASYEPGNRLHVVPAFGCLNLEYLGEVVRVEELPFGEYGVAVRLLRVEKMKATARSTTLSAFEAFSRVDSAPESEPECELVNS
jgi:PilZ domain-containing protein